VPYQQAPDPPMDEAHRRACARALHVYTADGRWLRSGRAALFVLERTTPLLRVLAKVGRVPPFVWGVELGYLLVARNRHTVGKLLGMIRRVSAPRRPPDR
jgi:hypothetical protein